MTLLKHNGCNFNLFHPKTLIFKLNIKRQQVINKVLISWQATVHSRWLINRAQVKCYTVFRPKLLLQLPVCQVFGRGRKWIRIIDFFINQKRKITRGIYIYKSWWNTQWNTYLLTNIVIINFYMLGVSIKYWIDSQL